MSMVTRLFSYKSIEYSRGCETLRIQFTMTTLLFCRNDTFPLWKGGKNEQNCQ